ncbi:MAG: C45 family autoproteolytic acyltransferase/hydrolase [Bdellovibrionia bacterium]
MNHRILRGVHFLKLKGSLSERLKAHYALLKKEIQTGALPALAKKNEGLIRRGPGLLQIPLIQNLVVRLYRHTLLPYMGLSLKRELKHAIAEASAAAEIPESIFYEGLFQADAMMLLARTSVMRHLLPDWVTQSHLPGCTSAVVLKNWTQEKRLLSCRNLDYPIVGPWEAHPTVLFNEPSEPGEIPHWTLTTAGVHFAGVTAMNLEGLTVFIHAHFGRRISLKGTPMVFIGDEIMRRAKTLGQAIEIAKKHQTYSNWSLVISSAQEQEAIVIEITPNDIQVRSTEEGYISQTNYFHHPALQKEEALISGGYRDDLEGRFCRMRSLLEEHRGELTARHLIQTLGDHVDPYSQSERIFANTISVTTTVNSAVFDPEQLRFWISNRLHSPVGLGDFIEVDTKRFWNTPLQEYESSMEVIPGYQPKHPKLKEAIHAYRSAYCHFHMNTHDANDLGPALTSLERAAALYPNDEHLLIQAALIAFKLKQFDKAFAYLTQTLSGSLTLHTTMVRDLFLARLHDLRDERSQALELYQKHPCIPEPKLSEAFAHGMEAPYHPDQTQSLVIDLHFPDVFEY